MDNNNSNNNKSSSSSNTNTNYSSSNNNNNSNCNNSNNQARTLLVRGFLGVGTGRALLQSNIYSILGLGVRVVWKLFITPSPPIKSFPIKSP